MKYNDSNLPLVCMQKNSTCYKQTGIMTIRGVLWHSTGANNPTLKRYVQPYETDSNYNEMITLLGKNSNGNDWNHIYHKAGLNAWIGKLADGTITTVQTMPWNYMPWGCGGNCNDGWIQFEICEDALNDANYFNQVYREACELTAYLCMKYNLDPMGKVSYSGKSVPVILCHADSYKLGMGGNHGDVLHWFPKFGKNMDDVRKDVLSIMNEMEDENMTNERFTELMNEYRNGLRDNDCGTWSEDARRWNIEQGLFAGSGAGADGNPNYMWEDLLTREQAAQLFYRFAQLMGKA